MVRRRKPMQPGRRIEKRYRSLGGEKRQLDLLLCSLG